MGPLSGSRKRIAVVGAGPIGLEAAVYARRLGHDVVVYERGEVADHVRSWGFVALFSPWGMNTTPLGWKTIGRAIPDPKLCPTGNELRDQYLLPLAAAIAPSIRGRTQVLSVGHDDHATSLFRLLVRDTEGVERVDTADAVLDCSGTYGHHRWAGRGGIPAPGERGLEPRIWYRLPDVLGRDKARFAGKHTLVLGAGFSAATVLLSLNHLHREDPRTRASWAIRRVGQAMQALHNDPLPARASLVKSSIDIANHPPDWLQYLGNCVLEKVDDGTQLGVTLRYMETDMALVVDELVALVGYGPDPAILEPLQVHPDYGVVDGPLQPKPRFFVLGAKSFGTNSNFLLQVGHNQVRGVFRHLSGDANLDLYATP